MKPAQITFTGISGINLLVAIPITPVIKVAIIIATIVFRLNLSLPVRPSEFSESEKLSALSDFPAFLLKNNLKKACINFAIFFLK